MSTNLSTIVTLEALATALNQRQASCAILPPKLLGGSYDAIGNPTFQVMVERWDGGRHITGEGVSFQIEQAISLALVAFDRNAR